MLSKTIICLTPCRSQKDFDLYNNIFKKDSTPETDTQEIQPEQETDNQTSINIQPKPKTRLQI